MKISGPFQLLVSAYFPSRQPKSRLSKLHMDTTNLFNHMHRQRNGRKLVFTAIKYKV